MKMKCENNPHPMAVGVRHCGCLVDTAKCHKDHCVSGKEKEHPRMREQGRDDASKHEKHCPQIEEAEDPHVGCLGYGGCRCETGESGKKKGGKCRRENQVEHAVGMKRRGGDTKVQHTLVGEHENKHRYNGVDEGQQKKRLVGL